MPPSSPDATNGQNTHTTMDKRVETALAVLRTSLSDNPPAIGDGGTSKWYRDQIADAISQLEKPVTLQTAPPSDESASNITVVELVERMLTLEARVADLQSDGCHLTNSISNINETLERISPFGMAEADEERGQLTEKVMHLEKRISDLEDTPESDKVQELGERVGTVESDLQDLKDELPVDWEDAITEKFDELVGDMMKGAVKDYVSSLRFRVVSHSEV